MRALCCGIGRVGQPERSRSICSCQIRWAVIRSLALGHMRWAFPISLIIETDFASSCPRACDIWRETLSIAAVTQRCSFFPPRFSRLAKGSLMYLLKSLFQTAARIFHVKTAFCLICVPTRCYTPPRPATIIRCQVQQGWAITAWTTG